MHPDEPIEHELLRNAVAAEVTVTNTEVSPTSTGDRYVRIEGRLGDDEESHAEWAALGFIYALGVLSFAAARPRGISDMDFVEKDQWTAADLLRHLRYERGRLVCETDYVRGRMMKTDVTVFPDDRFTLTTTNRGEAASRWVAQIQGKKVLRPFHPPTSPSRASDGAISRVNERVERARLRPGDRHSRSPLPR